MPKGAVDEDGDPPTKPSKIRTARDLAGVETPAANPGGP